MENIIEKILRKMESPIGDSPETAWVLGQIAGTYSRNGDKLPLVFTVQGCGQFKKEDLEELLQELEIHYEDIQVFESEFWIYLKADPG